MDHLLSKECKCYTPFLGICPFRASTALHSVGRRLRLQNGTRSQSYLGCQKNPPIKAGFLVDSKLWVGAPGVEPGTSFLWQILIWHVSSAVIENCSLQVSGPSRSRTWHLFLIRKAFYRWTNGPNFVRNFICQTSFAIRKAFSGDSRGSARAEPSARSIPIIYHNWA